MDAHILSPDTQVTLLLCGDLGQSRGGEFKPLSVAEYNHVARALHSQQMRPADLIEQGALARLNGGLDRERLSFLLSRGGALAVVSENWASKGLWVLSRSDPQYPQQLRTKLNRLAPPLLYGSGNRDLLSCVGWAIIGSREADEAALAFARRAAQACVREQLVVISGGARGVDLEAMLAALERGGQAIGVLADSLAKASVLSKYRQALRSGDLVLVSPYDPEAGFSASNAMGRNKYVYALSEAALVVNSAYNQGGTWAGAVEDLQHAWVPLLVRAGPDVPEGNKQLLNKGGLPLPAEVLEEAQSVRDWYRRLQSRLGDTETADPLLPGFGT